MSVHKHAWSEWADYGIGASFVRGRFCRSCYERNFDSDGLTKAQYDGLAKASQMSAIVHTLPGLVDEAHRVTETIPVIQLVDHEKNDYDVHLDVSGHVDLIALARAIRNDEAASAEWTVAMFGNGSRATMAAAELRRIPAIRAALTISIDPAEAGLAAGSLAERLEEAALEPARCAYNRHDCKRFAIGEDELCEEHLADLAEHGPFEDRGSYDYGDDAS